MQIQALLMEIYKKNVLFIECIPGISHFKLSGPLASLFPIEMHTIFGQK